MDNTSGMNKLEEKDQFLCNDKRDMFIFVSYFQTTQEGINDLLNLVLGKW